MLAGLAIEQVLTVLVVRRLVRLGMWLVNGSVLLPVWGLVWLATSLIEAVSAPCPASTDGVLCHWPLSAPVAAIYHLSSEGTLPKRQMSDRLGP